MTNNDRKFDSNNCNDDRLANDAMGDCSEEIVLTMSLDHAISRWNERRRFKYYYDRSKYYELLEKQGVPSLDSILLISLIIKDTVSYRACKNLLGELEVEAYFEQKGAGMERDATVAMRSPEELVVLTLKWMLVRYSMQCRRQILNGLDMVDPITSKLATNVKAALLKSW